MTDQQTDWSVAVDLSKIEGWDPNAPVIPWTMDADKRFSDADGTSVGVSYDVTLVAAAEIEFSDGRWSPAPVGTTGHVLAFVESPQGPVWLELDCSGPGGATHAFVEPSHVRFLRTFQEALADARDRAAGRTHQE